MKSIVSYPTRIMSKTFQYQQNSHFIESLWLTVSLFTLFGVTGILALFAMSYATASTVETSRIDEAMHLLSTYCSTAKGATLSKEFARCEDANVLVKNRKLSRMRVWEATWKNALNRDVGGSFREISNALIFFFVFFLFIYAGKKVNRRPETEMYSALAQSRLHSTYFLPEQEYHEKLE